jgi:hypothetical protein
VKVDGGVVALLATLVLATAGFFWRAATLKSYVYKEYSTRLSLALAGLDECAAAGLRRLAGQVNEALGDASTFDPDRALGDPGPLKDSVDFVSKALAAKRRLPRYFSRMLRVGPLLMVALVVVLAGEILALTYFSGWKRDRAVGYVGVWLATLFGAVAIVGVALFAYWLQRFSTAEVLSSSSSRD